MQWRGWNALMFSVAHGNADVFDQLLEMPNIALDTKTTVSPLIELTNIKFLLGGTYFPYFLIIAYKSTNS